MAKESPGLPVLCDRVVRYGLVGLIAFTPLAFGTVEAWSIALMEWGTVTLALVALLGRAWPPARSRPRRGATGLEIPIVLFLLFGLLQTVPLPIGWLQAIAPGTAALHAPSGPEEAGTSYLARPGAVLRSGEVGGGSHHSISVAPGATRERTRLLAVFAVLLLLCAHWGDHAGRVLFFLKAVVVVGFLVAVEGLVQLLTWNGKIYWFRNVPPSSAFGPFVNHNHFAGYVEMVIPIALSLAVTLLGRDAFEPREAGTSLWERLANLVRGRERRGDGSRSLAGLAFFAAVILIVGLFFSQSRGGILSSLISGMILFILLSMRVRSRARLLMIGIVTVLLVAMLIAWIGADVIIQRMSRPDEPETEASFRSRLLVWQSMLRHQDRYLWAGSGLGTFEESFAPFTPPGSQGRWDRAHNDYLQFLWEGGLVGCLIGLAGLWTFTRRYWIPALRSGAHPIDLYRTGIAVSLLSIGLHSLVDFNLQIGSNGFLCALLAGLLVALHRAREGESPAPAARGPAV